MDDFDDVVCCFRVSGNTTVSGDSKKTVSEITVPFLPGKELAVQVSFWAYAGTEILPSGKDNCVISVCRNGFSRRAWCIWRHEVEGHRVLIKVEPGDRIKVSAINACNVDLHVLNMEITLYSKDETPESTGVETGGED